MMDSSVLKILRRNQVPVEVVARSITLAQRAVRSDDQPSNRNGNPYDIDNVPQVDARKGPFRPPRPRPRPREGRRRDRLRSSNPDPAGGDPPDPRGPRRDRHRPDRLRQDRRLPPPDPPAPDETARGEDPRPCPLPHP